MIWKLLGYVVFWASPGSGALQRISFGWNLVIEPHLSVRDPGKCLASLAGSRNTFHEHRISAVKSCCLCIFHYIL